MEGEKFKPIDLTDENVNKLFEVICAESEFAADTYVKNLVEVEDAARFYRLSKTKLQEEEKSIRYLMGQLAVVHEKYDPNIPFDVTELGRKYTNSNGESSYWTTNPNTIVTLLTMASFFEVTYPIVKTDSGRYITGLATDKITPTYSPKDTKNFPRWWIRARKEWEA